MTRLVLVAVSLAALGWSTAALAAAPNENPAQPTQQQTPAHPEGKPAADSARTTNCQQAGSGADNNAQTMNCTPSQSGSSQPPASGTTPKASGGNK